MVAHFCAKRKHCINYHDDFKVHPATFALRGNWVRKGPSLSLTEMVPSERLSDLGENTELRGIATKERPKQFQMAILLSVAHPTNKLRCVNPLTLDYREGYVGLELIDIFGYYNYTLSVSALHD
jgi:hypothetical protein